MKKYRLTALALLLAAMLPLCCSCDGNDASAPSAEADAAAAAEVDPDALITGLLDKYAMTDGFVFTSSSTELGEYLDADLIASYYGDAAESPDFTKVARYCVYVDESDPKALLDVGLFEMSDPSYGSTFMQYLQARIDDKIAAAHTYTDIDVAMLETAVVKQEGPWVYYSVNYDAAAIADEIAAALK